MKAEHFALAILAVVVDVALVIWNAFAASVLWAWFAVPLFGLPPLSIAYAIGIGLIAALLLGRREPPDSRPFAEAMIDTMAKNALRPALALGIGWLTKGFI